jgi:CubicO group peptidase (beta-lactamase class C family)
MTPATSLTPNALEYVHRHGLDALVIAQHGHVVGEAYGEGYDASTPHALFSGTKSFWGIAAVTAEQDGIVRLDDRVADTFLQWSASTWKKSVTLRHLLELTSGIGFWWPGLGCSAVRKCSRVRIEKRTWNDVYVRWNPPAGIRSRHRT